MNLTDGIGTGVGAAAVGLLVDGAKRIYGRLSKARAQRETQPVLITGHKAVVRDEVELTPSSREALGLSRNESPSNIPRLFIGSGGIGTSSIVRPEVFVGQAADELTTQLPHPVPCSRCGQARTTGAYLDRQWWCVGCFFPYLRELPTGDTRLFKILPTLETPSMPALPPAESHTAIRSSMSVTVTTNGVTRTLHGDEAKQVIAQMGFSSHTGPLVTGHLGIVLGRLGIDLRRYGIDLDRFLNDD